MRGLEETQPSINFESHLTYLDSNLLTERLAVDNISRETMFPLAGLKPSNPIANTIFCVAPDHVRPPFVRRVLLPTLLQLKDAEQVNLKAAWMRDAKTSQSLRGMSILRASYLL